VAGLTIELAVSGGLAGADYAVVVDGGASALRGVRCERLCDFEDGAVLRSLTRAELDDLSRAFVAAGILELGDRDFGEQCCDQFHFQLAYSESRGAAAVRGSSEVLPGELNQAIRRILALIPS
jgi:hypothetical protein